MSLSIFLSIGRSFFTRASLTARIVESSVNDDDTDEVLRRQRRRRQQDGDDVNDNNDVNDDNNDDNDDNDNNDDNEVPRRKTKLSPSHHATLRARLRGHGRMSFAAVYPQDASSPFKKPRDG